MQTFTAVVEKCSDTGLYVGYVPGFPSAHSHELHERLREVISMLLADGEPVLEARQPANMVSRMSAIAAKVILSRFHTNPHARKAI